MMMNSSSVNPSTNMHGPLHCTGVNIPLSTTVQSTTGSSLFINKLKIVGSGQNWAVAPCEPFYLMGTEPPAPDVALTGAKNLIEHYGLGNAYQKFCSKPLREELSAFLPHLTGNVDVPASVDGSGLLSLIERPPIRGKELRPFAPGQLDPAFRLHPGPLPQEYAALFAAAPPAIKNIPNTQSDATVTAPHGSRIPATAAPGLSGPGASRRRRRYEVHRGIGMTSSNSASGSSALTPASNPNNSNSFFAGPGSTAVLGGAPLTASSNLSHSGTPASGDPPRNRSNVDHPPGLIPVSSAPTLHSDATIVQSQHKPPPPPPLLSSVHQIPGAPRLATTVAPADYQHQQTTSLPGPPVLQSIHLSTPASSRSSEPVGGIFTPSMDSPSTGDWSRSARQSDEDYRKKKRKEKKRRKDKDS